MLTIDHIAENIPNISWETIKNPSTPVSFLFFFDTAYTLEVGISVRREFLNFFLLQRHE